MTSGQARPRTVAHRILGHAIVGAAVVILAPLVVVMVVLRVLTEALAHIARGLRDAVSAVIETTAREVAILERWARGDDEAGPDPTPGDEHRP